MKQQTQKTALDLALALKRYNAMRDPTKAYSALHDEWPPRIANIIVPIFWSEIPLRSEKQMVADLRSLQKKAAAQSAAVQRFIQNGMSAKKAVAAAMATTKRRRTTAARRSAA